MVDSRDKDKIRKSAWDDKIIYFSPWENQEFEVDGEIWTIKAEFQNNGFHCKNKKCYWHTFPSKEEVLNLIKQYERQSELFD
jgi:hypothetical protein